ncbi:MAG: hypothetical protein RJA98_1785 [Pseudomonadota bacterium]
MPMTEKHTLVIDIGKSNAKLLVVDAHGAVLSRLSRPNQSEPDPQHGTTALGVAGLQAWLLSSIPWLPDRERIGRISISTHGAAFCAINDEGLVLPPIDYEWDGYDAATRRDFAVAQAPFSHTGSPDLPQGLNAGIQLFWLQRQHPTVWARIRHWLPYPQYWAWWLSSVAASEVSSLGCHTGLWSPVAGRYSDWAQRSGIAALFAPLRRAWAPLGTVRPALAEALGLPLDCEVLCGVHDSNACLARYLRDAPDTTLLTTGTWTLAMSPSGTTQGLHAERDELLNVAVDGRAVPTARFMGGREFAALCGDADPALATERALAKVLAEGWSALPAFAEAGGAHAGRQGLVLRDGEPVQGGPAAVPASLRPALAALYCAQLSAQMLQSLGATGPVMLEGPLAGNAAYGKALAALIAPRPLRRATDPLEGTARGAWMLAHWQSARPAPPLSEALPPPPPALAEPVRRAHAAWLAQLASAPTLAPAP